jgi:plastocyanin
MHISSTGRPGGTGRRQLGIASTSSRRSKPTTVGRPPLAGGTGRGPPVRSERMTTGMKARMKIPAWWLALAVAVALAGCSDDDDDGDITTPGDGTSSSRTVTVGNIFFESNSNSTRNPAVDTVSTGGTVTWDWSGTGNVPHSVESEGTPQFTSSSTLTGDDQSYTVTFPTAGTYQYDCAVHGSQMTGTIVVR